MPVLALVTCGLLTSLGCEAPGGFRPGSPEDGARRISACAKAEDVDGATVRPALRNLERESGARVGVHALHTGSDAAIAYRADRRFGHASTVKLLTAGALLAADADLERRLTWGPDDLVPYSPVTERRGSRGMTLRALMRAAVTHSDNTAANLLLAELGGPTGLQRSLARIGDTTTVVSRNEPELNDWVPGQRRDTTTPRALAESVRAFVLEHILPAPERRRLWRWLHESTTGLGLVRAGVPDSWPVGDKSGTAAYGTRNDVAVVRPPGSSPIVLAVMTAHHDPAAEPDDTIVAAATRIAVSALCGRGQDARSGR